MITLQRREDDGSNQDRGRDGVSEESIPRKKEQVGYFPSFISRLMHWH